MDFNYGDLESSGFNDIMKERAEISKVIDNVDNSAAILSKVAALYTERHMCDLCLKVGGIEFPCHRLILSASSDVFQIMLNSASWSESVASRIELVEPPECLDIFDDFLRYFYTGSIRMNLENVMPILLLADKYNVRDLVSHSLEFMSSHMAKAAVAGCLVQWMQYTHLCGHKTVARACRDFVSWNIPLLANKSSLACLDLPLISSLLQQSDLVIYNEMSLYRAVLSWLQVQQEQISNEAEMEELVVKVMSHIRFPMMTPRQLADLVLCPVARKYKDFFMDRLALGMAFHSGNSNELEKMLRHEDGHLQLTPRLYTANAHASLVTVENFRAVPVYHTGTLVFTSHTALADHEGDRVCEWVVDVHPKGVWIKRCYLISYEGNVEVPGHVLRTIRISITCKDPPPPNAPDIRVKIGILVYGSQDGVEYVRSLTQRVHQFSETDRVLHIDDLLPFQALNPTQERPSVAKPSPYLVGHNRDVLKMHVVIEPLAPLPSVRH